MTRYFYLIILLLLAGCAPSNLKTDSSRETAPETEAETVKSRETDSLRVLISKNLIYKFSSVQLYYNEGLKCLLNKDTVGAGIYFENALDRVSDFTDEERDEISENPLFEDILKNLDSDYRRIFRSSDEITDNEEVMQDISEMEEALKTDTSAVAITVETDSTDKFPITVNGRVAAAMKYFQTKGRRIFTRWLERSGRYKELYQQILREEGVPEELFYLAMIESGFVNHAYSYARAAGPWQFMAGTGGMYGLRHSWWFDERRDPIKSTRAAAKHLNYLYDMFDDWLLAIAGYNVSPRKVMRRCQIQKTRDFWKLRKLPRQTLNYVPTYTAAVIMAREPEKYGFFPEYYPPLQIDTVIVHEAIDLSLIAQWTDTTYKAIKELNPAVLRWCTPPGVKNFSVNIPRGKKEAFYKGLKSIPESEKLSYIRYRIREGDVLGNIARKFGVSVSVIKKQNHLRGSRIYAGKYLIIPVPKNRSAYYASYRKKSKTYKKKNYAPKSIPGRKKVIYVVKSGDTVGQIAEDYHIRASEIRRWNGISRRSIIHPGQKLTIFTPDPDAVSLSAITKKVNNDFSLKPGELVYTVKSGDTLWKIAQEYNTSIKKLKQRNQIGNTIKPGEKLIITQ